LDPYDAVYKDLPKKHHILKKAKNCEFCMQRDSQVKGPPSVAGKGKLTYIFQSYWLNYADCFQVRLTRMQSIFRSTFGILTRTSLSQVLEFPLIIILRLHEVLGCIVLKHTVRYIIDWISCGWWERASPYAAIFDETIAHRVKRSPKLDTTLIRLILGIVQDNP
jgi:hypothetical protein